jgi:hypothetical protein
MNLKAIPNLPTQLRHSRVSTGTCKDKWLVKNQLFLKNHVARAEITGVRNDKNFESETLFQSNFLSHEALVTLVLLSLVWFLSYVNKTRWCLRASRSRNFLFKLLVFFNVVQASIFEKLLTPCYLGWCCPVRGELLKQRNLRAKLGRLTLSSSVYNIWRNINELRHRSASKSEEWLLKNIFWEVRSKILDKGWFHRN